MARYDEFGRELENNEPVELAVDFKRPPTIHEMIAQAVRSEGWKQKMLAEGRETFEEANDFDVGDDVEPDSKYEVADDSAFAEEEKKLLDRAAKDMDNERALNEERKRRQDGTERERARDDREGDGYGREERAEVGGEGRTAARRGRRVSEVRGGSDGRDKESSGRDGEERGT